MLYKKKFGKSFVTFLLIALILQMCLTPFQTAYAADILTATPTASSVTVDGVAVAFDAYNINGYNYFKLRDLAYALRGTKKQFEVSWDSTSNAITILSGKSYTVVGGELGAKQKSATTALRSSACVFLDGVVTGFDAYNINGNNYFKLRDVAEAVNFGVTFDSATGMIAINTSSAYNSNSSAAGTVEAAITAALKNKSSYLFKIMDDHIFKQNVVGYKLFKGSSGTTTYPQTTAWAQDSLKSCSSGFVIRIDNGVVSMEDSAHYKCSLTTAANGGGVSLVISSADSTRTDITGTIKGNILSAHEYVAAAAYSSYTESGYGFSASGDYTVSVAELPKEQWPPLSLTLYYSYNRDRSVTLTWRDSNDSDAVAYYEIYRNLDNDFIFDLAATVSNCSTWTDSSSETVNGYQSIAEYYIVAYNAAGVASPASNHIFCSCLI